MGANAFSLNLAGLDHLRGLAKKIPIHYEWHLSSNKETKNRHEILRQQAQKMKVRSTFMPGKPENKNPYIFFIFTYISGFLHFRS
ncbi:conserved protein [Methanosarcina mazei Go1]|uniref:Conserved protein n=2 Tax=Methanosarcina mazei TaxID=2209 RepID=Q8PS98_METMA|nr:conserved protein [Methanosarcina mazei Go1]BBL64651.1 hypothetical protein MmazTMA_16280 [Methanosarcina mazei]